MTTTRANNRTTSARPTCPPVPPPPSGSDGASFPAPAAPFSGHQNGAPAPSPEPDPKPGEGRDRGGRFVRGHAGGPGRPRRAVEVEYAAALGSVVTLDEWKEVCQTALRQAKEGDDKARQFLAKYLLGERPPSMTVIAAAETRAGQDQRLGDGDVWEALARQIGGWISMRLGYMKQEFDLAERALEEAEGQE
jgi:hypothetical protein